MLNPSDKRFAQEQIIQFSDGDIIFQEGEDSREMYIVQEGQVKILKKTMSENLITLAILHRGEFFGEMALLNSLPRNATTIAIGQTRLLKINPGGFLLKIRRDPTFAFEMLQSLCFRIREINGQLLDVMSRNQISESEIEPLLRHFECLSSKKANAH